MAEKVLAGLHFQAEQLDDEQLQLLEQLLSDMVGAIGANLFDYIMDKHATHVARALLVAVTGRDVLSPAGKKQKQQQLQQSGDELVDQDGVQQKKAHAAGFSNQPVSHSTSAAC